MPDAQRQLFLAALRSEMKPAMKAAKAVSGSTRKGWLAYFRRLSQQARDQGKAAPAS